MKKLIPTMTMFAALLAAGPVLAQSEPVKIGVILPMTGQQASTGRQIAAAVKLWVAQNGDTAGGRKVEVIIKDDGSVPDATRRLARCRRP
jgi:branched-chain amino acid transport system substrate-binding protein